MYVIKAVGARCEYTNYIHRQHSTNQSWNNLQDWSLQHCFDVWFFIGMSWFIPCRVRPQQYNQNTTPHRIVSAFCIASNCQLIRLICWKFWFWAAISHAIIRFGNTEMVFIANIESKMMAAERITQMLAVQNLFVYWFNVYSPST